MRFYSTVLALCVSVSVSGVSGGKPSSSDWNGISSLGKPLDYLFGPFAGETPSPWTLQPRSNNPDCGTDNKDPCCQYIVDPSNAAQCCIGTHYDSKSNAYVEDVDYGQCQSSSQNNCPGAASAFCNSGANADNTLGGGSCPEFVDFNGGVVYPRCRLASATCGSHGTSHCWGILACFSDPAGQNPTPCPAGGFKDFNSEGAAVTYHEGAFCYEDGHSTNTKWCGSCPAGTTFEDDGKNKDICACPNESDVIDANGNCCAGTLDLEGICCPAPKEVIGGVICCEAQGPQGERECKGGNPTQGDPQIGGFQGQSFQFHGLADEVFNLISAPTLQINSRFVYLSSGKCDYNDTMCWSHPGTYIDQLGFSFGSHRLKLVAGPHRVGMHIDMDGDKMTKGVYHFHTNDTDVNIHFKHHGSVTIATHQFVFNIYNSDTFFNLEASMLDQRLLKIGEPKHTITDKHLCRKEESLDESQLQASRNTHVHNHGAVEAAIDKKYGGAQVPLHGLIGQTWRNVLVCGKHWVGSVTDYLASDLFASDYVFNFYQAQE